MGFAMPPGQPTIIEVSKEGTDLTGEHGRITDGDADDLTEALRAGHPDAIGALYDRLGRQAFGLAYRILEDGQAAEDVVQEAFLTVWRRAATLDPAKGKVSSLLLTIVHRRSIDALRARKGLVALQAGVEAAETADDPAGLVELSMRQEEVREAVQTLPPEQKEALDLAYFKGLTHVEISESTGIPLGTVKSRLRLALQKLKSELSGIER
ncbi:MAG: sigma-70 family RNA polymerase sigma factor [Dehalococcoidia bacterium]